MPAWSLDGSKAPAYRRARVRVREVMDDPALDPALREEALKGIEAISHWAGQRRPLLREILGLLGKPARKYRLIEIGAGSGHLSRWVEAELKKRGYEAEVLATDIFPYPGVGILDGSRGPLPEADIYFSSLVLHHLGDWQACRMMLLQSQAAKIGFVHFELRRHWLYFQLVKLAVKAARLHPINQIDALLSVQQSFTRQEIKTFATATGLKIRVKASLPFRWLLTWRR